MEQFVTYTEIVPEYKPTNEQRLFALEERVETLEKELASLKQQPSLKQ